MFGWKSLAEAELYTRAANRKRMAAEGMAKVAGGARSGNAIAPTYGTARIRQVFYRENSTQV